MPFSSTLPIWLRLDRLGHRQGGQLADQHRPGARGRLEACGGVDGVAGDAALVRTGRGVHDLAGVDADPQLEAGRRHAQACLDLLECADERQARPHRPFRVVVAGAWCAEDGHRGVADELLDHAAVALDRLAGRGEVGVLDRGHVLGVELLGQRREADEVGEQDADDATLGRGGHGSRLGCLGHAWNSMRWQDPPRLSAGGRIGQAVAELVRGGRAPGRGSWPFVVALGASANEWP